MDYDDIQPGDTVTITPRDRMAAAVVRKFISTSACSIAPTGTQYVRLINLDGVEVFNFPHQLTPR
ncbi:hypothetical protein [Nocardia suismassiliense]|uniref:hypothetical protein n=1 Tax=Nocardia suismassiliense TaxID=2077092 RepID=UPI000D1E6C8D|nr:hypothetical protein [Nocardia suismassiliense]